MPDLSSVDKEVLTFNTYIDAIVMARQLVQKLCSLSPFLYSLTDVVE